MDDLQVACIMASRTTGMGIGPLGTVIAEMVDIVREARDQWSPERSSAIRQGLVDLIGKEYGIRMPDTASDDSILSTLERQINEERANWRLANDRAQSQSEHPF